MKALAILLVSTSLWACGKERWDVKTLADADSATVDFISKATTIDELSAWRAPKSVLKLKLRVKPVETQTWRVSGLLVGYKLETDGDYHLVIADPLKRTVTMIVEVPDPQCMPLAYRPQVMAVRQQIDTTFGKPGKYKALTPLMLITVTGVGFFDVIHGSHKTANGEEKGQTGVAPNGIEIHPVLEIEFNGDKSRTNEREHVAWTNF